MKIKILIVGLFALLSINSYAQLNNSLKNVKTSVVLFDYYEYFEYNEYYDFFTFKADTTDIIIIDNDTNNIWQIASPNKENWNSGGSQYWPDTFPSKVLVTDSVNPYPPNNNSWFEIHIKNPEWVYNSSLYWNSLIFGFSYKSNTDTLKDGLLFEISLDGGNTYSNMLDSTNIYNSINGPDNVYFAIENLSFIQDSILGLSGNINDWKDCQIMINWDCGHSLNLDYAIIKVSFISDSIETGKKGIMLDNLNISVRDYCYDVGIKANNDNNFIEFYPNPVNTLSLLKFQNTENKIFTLEILNYTGQLIYKNNTQNNYFEVGKIPLQKGIYIYKLYNKVGIIKTDKFIKQ